MLSPSGWSGLVGMYHPFKTSSKKPFLSKRSRSPLGRSALRRATFACPWSFSRIASDFASCSAGGGNGVSLVYCVGLCLVYRVGRILVYCVGLFLVYRVYPILIWCKRSEIGRGAPAGLISALTQMFESTTATELVEAPAAINMNGQPLLEPS